jgi:hypothetical protein
MRLLTAVTLLLLVFAPASRAQERIKGSPSELKGLRRVYVDAGASYGSAYVPAPGGGRRVLFTWEGRRKLFASPAQKFAKAFVKEYRKANGRDRVSLTRRYV